MLDRLLGALPKERVDSEVICLAEEGPIASRIRERRIPLKVLGLQAGVMALSGLPRIVSHFRDSRPDVVHTWMYHADFLGGLAARRLGVPLVWALHSSTLDPVESPRSTQALVRVLATLSKRLPNRIVSCSRVGRSRHERLGYDASKMEVIPNGFDTTLFRPNTEIRRDARARWNATDEDIVVGHVARFHPQKDHRTLLRAAALSLANEPRLRFVLYGNDVTPTNRALFGLAEQLGITDRCSFLGMSSSTQDVFPGLDVLASSSSFGEAFPLVIGEAMACEVPCVVTDVGDSSHMVGSTGITVAPRDPEALARALTQMARLEPQARRDLGAEGRRNVEVTYGLAHVASLYADVYERVARE
jgi:glycosyltransferase involved in cell wall biosynthesis